MKINKNITKVTLLILFIIMLSIIFSYFMINKNSEMSEFENVDNCIDTLVGSSTSYEVIDINSVLNFNDRKQLFNSAREFVKANSAKGMVFDLILTKKIDNWVKFEVIPENIETDSAQLFMEKTNGVWEGKAFGTSFEGLSETHPELFK